MRKYKNIIYATVCGMTISMIANLLLNTGTQYYSIVDITKAEQELRYAFSKLQSITPTILGIASSVIMYKYLRSSK